MKIVITGSNGFVAKNLIAEMEHIKQYDFLPVSHSMDIKIQEESLSQADAVIHLAGVNRPVTNEEFTSGNIDYTAFLVKSLSNQKREIPVIFASSKQIHFHNEYGDSKAKAESILRNYSEETGSPVTILRFPNVFGKWAKPNYNSVVATFCHNIIRNLPIEIHDPSTVFELLYIDDVVRIILNSLKSTSGIHYIEEFVESNSISVQGLANQINWIDMANKNGKLPELRKDFDKYLFATYLSYLPDNDLVSTPVVHLSEGAEFIELLKSGRYGQISLNTIQPGITKGNHWHHTKHEKYIILSGLSLIRLRKKFSKEVYEVILDGSKTSVLDIPPGTVHSITNIGDKELITLMWASEIYDSEFPDTFKEDV
jgi:UDP-2-acetamido-2,6-beta-L-arabino-hexul-4-ose reductase